MRRARVEAAVRVTAAVVFVALLTGFSLALGSLTHPVLGWAAPTVVAGALAWVLWWRWLDDRQVRADLVAGAARRAGEPLTLPEGFIPGPPSARP